MAKKKPTEKISFSQLNDFLNKIAPDGEMIDINPIAKIDEWISTGSYILNAALSGSIFGGMPNRRSLVLAGEEATAKTYIALSICRNGINNQEYYVIYFDSEGAIDKEFVSRLGVDTSKLRLQPVNTIEEFSHIAAQITDSCEEMIAKNQIPPKFMIVLDSLGNLSSEKEVTDTTKGSDKRDMTKQQNIRRLFRVNGLKFAKLGIPFVICNHVYDSMSLFAPKEISGGGGVKYNASIIFILSKGKLEDKEGEKRAAEKNVDAVRVGVTIYVTPYKQRFARPIRVKLHIPFYKKPNPYVGLESFVSWDNVGIMRGKALTEKEYNKLDGEEKKICISFEGWEMKKWGNKGEQKVTSKMWALPSEGAKTLVCKHLGGEVPLSQLFTDKVFTKEILEQLDEKVIKPTFMLPSIESLEDLAEITKELEEEITEEEKEVNVK